MLRTTLIPIFQNGPVPFQFFRDVERDFNNLFTERVVTGTKQSHSFHQSEENYWLSVDLPGVNAADINLEFSTDKLSISAERKDPFSGEVFRKFAQEFILPKNADGTKAQAHYEHGVLRLAIPKSEASKPRKISVSTGALPQSWPIQNEKTEPSQE